MTIVPPSSMWALDSRNYFSMKRLVYLISLLFLTASISSCNYDQAEEFAIVTGIVEDGTESNIVVQEDCTTFSTPSVPSTVSIGGLKINLVVIQIAFEGSVNQESYGDPFSHQSF